MAVDNITLFLNRPRNILLYLGIWLQPASDITCLYVTYAAIVMVSQYSFVLFEFIYIALAWGDLDAVTEASFLLFTQASVCYKVTMFMINKNNLILLLSMMSHEVFGSQNERHDRCLQSQARMVKRLCLFFLCSALTTCTLWGLMPIVDSTGGERIFPFLIWMPVGPEKSPHYELGYLYQMVAIYISAFLFIAVDSVALSMIIFGCAQLEIIMDKVEQIEPVPMSSKLKKEERQRLIQENSELLVQCLKHHQAVIRFIETVEDTYHANIFFQLSGSVAIICIILLRISIVMFFSCFPIPHIASYQTTPGSVQFISMLNYMVTMLSQLFLYCWCGNELTIRSELLREVMYLSPWHEQSNSFRRMLWFAMERMKRPIIFKAGHYIALSRPTFVAVEDTYHSYLLFQLSGSVGLICMSALRILVVEWKSVQFMSMVLYLLCMISQLFVCCWSGHELTATSSELHAVMYECCWYEQDVRFKRALVFTMMRLGSPMVFRAGRYVTLSRQTFVAILRMSYSYFAVLKQTNSRNEIVEYDK